MSTDGINFAMTRSGLSPSERLVLVALCHKLPENKPKDKVVLTTFAALVRLLEMQDATCRHALAELRKRELIDWKVIVSPAGKKQTEVTINLVDPFIEDQRQRLADNKMDLQLDMFTQNFWPSYPKKTSREAAWRAWLAQNIDDSAFFRIMEDMAHRLASEWIVLSAIPAASVYLKSRCWETPRVPALIKAGAVAPQPAKAGRLPADWKLPKSWGDWAVENTEMTGKEIIALGEEFGDYWRARADSGAIKLDWFATWRNRVRQVQAGRGGHGRSFAEKTKEFKEQQGKEKFQALAGADADYLAKWGFSNGKQN